MPHLKTTAPNSFASLADRALERLRAARSIADGCRHDGTLHRASMNAVFVLEDTFFTLHQAAAAAKPLAGSTINPPTG